MIVKKLFSQERFCTWPRFKTEAGGISEMPISLTSLLVRKTCHIFLFTLPSKTCQGNLAGVNSF